MESLPLSFIKEIIPKTCSIFFNYLRVVCEVVFLDEFQGRGPDFFRAVVEIDGVDVPQIFQVADDNVTFSLQALIDPKNFPKCGRINVYAGSGLASIELQIVADKSFERNAMNAIPRAEFVNLIEQFIAENPGSRPKVLDIGGRKRSGVSNTDDLIQCDVTIFDIVDEPGVDVVGDAHELSQHFPRDYFDFVLSVSVFEHILMPWKVAIEMNKVMKIGGYAHIHTHQTIGMHDLPWDFWRFSDSAWSALFNTKTGFKIVRTGLGHFLHILTAGWHPRYLGAEASGGFESSGVLLQKSGATDLEWDVSLPDVINTDYPTHKITV